MNEGKAPLEALQLNDTTLVDMIADQPGFPGTKVIVLGGDDEPGADVHRRKDWMSASDPELNLQMVRIVARGKELSARFNDLSTAHKWIRKRMQVDIDGLKEKLDNLPNDIESAQVLRRLARAFDLDESELILHGESVTDWLPPLFPACEEM